MARAKKKPGKVSEAKPAVVPLVSLEERRHTGRAIAAARALGRTANAYKKACEGLYWGTSRWAAVLAARNAVGRAFYRALGAPHPSKGESAASSLTRKWGTLEGYADGAAAREVVLEGQRAFFALRAAAGLDLKTRRTHPLDAWFSAHCASEGLTYTAPPSPTTAERDAQQLAELLAEREAALAGAASARALERAWDDALDDGWADDVKARLGAVRAARAHALADRLLRRVTDAATATALARAWDTAKRQGRANELAAAHAAARERLGLTDSQATHLAA